jgi:hypothetical protein
MSSPTAQTIGLYGYMFTFPLSLITFFSPTLRKTSTGLLFICLTMSDIFYQLMSIGDFSVQIPGVTTSQSEDLCRFCTFILN